MEIVEKLQLISCTDVHYGGFALALRSDLNALMANSPSLLSTPAASAGRSARGRRGADVNLYQIWLRSFTSEGTLRAASARLAFLAELGVKMILVSPFLKQSTDQRQQFWSPRMRISQSAGVGNPYRLADYDEVDAEFGAEEDFIAFVRHAHDLGMGVLMDVVLYHTGPDFVHPEYHARDQANALVLGKWNFPVVNYESELVRRAMLERLTYWAERWLVDGFRCDVSSGIPIDFWAEARVQLDRINPEMLLLGDGTREELETVFDLGYNESYYTVISRVFRGGESASLLRLMWSESQSAFASEARRLLYSDTLDKKRACVAFGEDAAASIAVLNFTLGGVPFVYNGQEFGDGTPCEILSRQAIRWDTAHLDSTTLQPPRLLTLYRNLYALRDQEAALRSGIVRWVSNSAPDDMVSYVKKSGTREMLIVVNTTNRKRRVSLELDVNESFSPENQLPVGLAKIIVNAGKFTMELESFGFFAGSLNRS